MGAGSSRYGSSTRAEEVEPDVDVTGKTVVITGANTGIGYETARVFLSRGAHVVLACRSPARGEAALASLKSATGSDEVELLQLDLGSQSSVRAAAASLKGRRIDILINNAGIMALPTFSTTEDGIEKQWGVNHVGHFLFTTLLLPELRASAPCRVVCVSSLAHDAARKRLVTKLPPSADHYHFWTNYGDSKLSNILFARRLNTLEAGNGVTAFSLHPGVIPTELGRHSSFMSFFYKVGGVFMKSIPQGAATTMYCALAEDAVPGGYHADCAPKKSRRPEVVDDEAAAALWELTEGLVGLK